MCGIAGLIGRLDELNRAALVRMNDAMFHRGPDASGTWTSTSNARGWGAMLAHRRLSILDLSPAGAQPMVDPVTGCVVSFNGEIYNFRDLRKRLEGEGQTFQSTGDTAVMLRSIGLRGAGAVGGLRGMFAFACWDPRRRTLLLARDHLGIKPLYVARSSDPRSGWSIAFASELRALLASGLLESPRLDPSAVAASLWNGFVVGPATAVHGVELVWPGHLLEFDDTGREIHSEDFWRMSAAAAGATLDVDELATILPETLSIHLASDVPLAVLLSGGVDSSAMANLAQQASRDPINTFTLSFEEQDLDEGPIANQVAAQIGSRHHEVVLTEQRFVNGIETALDSLDQPTFDALNTYFVSRSIRDAGFSVALSGTGGDELLGGYPTFRDLPVLYQWSHRTRLVPPGMKRALASAAARLLSRSGSAVPAQTRWAKLPDMATHGLDLLSLYQLAYAQFLPDFQRQLLSPDFASPLVDGLPDAMRRRLEAETDGREPLAAIGVMEQRLFLGERLLRDSDAASMACSLEQRLPLVDHVLADAVDRLPAQVRFNPLGRKAILRQIGLRGLDPALFERRKSGFVLPFERWLRRGLKASVNEALRDRQAVTAAGLVPAVVEKLWQAYLDGAPGLHWSRVWSIYVLVRWCQRNKVFR